MTERSTRVTPPPKPVLVFDGECALCASWAAGVQRRAGEKLECIPFQDPLLAARFPGLAGEHLEQSVHLVGIDGEIHRGVQAILRIPGGGSVQKMLHRLCGRSPAVARVAELVYRLIAASRHRVFPKLRQ